MSLGRGGKFDLKQTYEVWAGWEKKGANVSCQIMTFQVIYTSLPIFWTSSAALNSYLGTWNWQPEQEPRPAACRLRRISPSQASWHLGRDNMLQGDVSAPSLLPAAHGPRLILFLLGNALDGELKLHLFLAKRWQEEVLINFSVINFIPCLCWTAC